MSKKLKPESPHDDNPEWSARDVAQALPAAQVLLELFGDKQAQDMLKPRGRPALERPKEHVNIRLDADIVGAFRQTGAGWQTRVNNALRDWLKAHPKQSLIRR